MTLINLIFVEGDLSHENAIHSFVYHNEVLIVLLMQNKIPEKNKRYESNRNIHPKYERLSLAVYSHHVI